MFYAFFIYDSGAISPSCSVALNRRHLSEGQKAYLANEYMKVISEKKKSQAGKKAVIAREIKRGSIDEDTLSQSISEGGMEEGRSRKIASEKFHVGERKVREAHEIENIDKKVYEKLGKGELGIHEATQASISS